MSHHAQTYLQAKIHSYSRGNACNFFTCSLKTLKPTRQATLKLFKRGTNLKFNKA